MRFPVKSFGGERLRRAFVGAFGVIGDRALCVVGAEGQPLSARRAPGLLGFRASSADRDGAGRIEVRTPSGRRLGWDDPELLREVQEAVGRPVRLLHGHAGWHDAAAVHVVSDASLAAVERWVGTEVDRRRFRANVVVELSQPAPFAEAAWTGMRLAIGERLLLQVVSPTERCAVTTIDPDTLERDNRVLSALALERENLFGLYAQVLRPGWAAVGDAVRLASAAQVDRTNPGDMLTVHRGVEQSGSSSGS
jgi:uncharacterized protein YcbX